MITKYVCLFVCLEWIVLSLEGAGYGAKGEKEKNWGIPILGMLQLFTHAEL